jgi:diguanylate cyclase (GGDEF)-like protein
MAYRGGSVGQASAAGWRHRSAGGGSFIVDGNDTVLGFDQGMEDLTGWPAVDVVGRSRPPVLTIKNLDPGEPAGTGRANGAVPVGPDAESARFDLKLACRDGRILEVEAEAVRLPGSGGRTTVSVLRVLARSGSPQVETAVGGRDPLTGLADRAFFERMLALSVEDATREARPLALVLADVDHLRRVNDRMGRTAGDEVLLKLAGILRASLDDDAFVARLGEDDFAVLLPGAGRGDARQFAARLRSTVERFRFGGLGHLDRQARVTLSLGAASFPADADGGSDLLARSREALDEARLLGRNRVWCYLRRPRVPLRAPVYFDGERPLLLGFTRDLSPSGIFVETPVPIEIGMRCALSFPLPAVQGNVHVIGRVVRAVPPETTAGSEVHATGMGIEFERFGPEDRRAIDGFLHASEASTLRPENGTLSF